AGAGAARRRRRLGDPAAVARHPGSSRGYLDRASLMAHPDRPDDTRSRDSDFAALWSSDGVTRSFSPTASSQLPADLPFLFNPGQQFGPYVIVRPRGKGGMGQVYEAEESESGRRVALKLLSRGLGDDEERERFLREGRLAASLSHPNCVYVFGTSEIQGFPVIAMELVPHGPLKAPL